MVVLQIEIGDFFLLDFKGQPPVATDRNAPCPGAVAHKLVDAPTRRAMQRLYVARRDHRRKHPSQTRSKIVAQFAAVVVPDKAQQSPVPDTSNNHSKCTLRPYKFQEGGYSAPCRRLAVLLVANVPAPARPLAFLAGFRQRQMREQPIRRGAVPMLGVGRDVDRVARVQYLRLVALEAVAADPAQAE